MTEKTVGIIGKSKLAENEEALLVTLGRTIARAKRTLLCVDQPGTVAAVKVGVKMEGGEVRLLDKDTITKSAHTFVYADERLMTRLRKAYPTIDQDKHIFLMKTPEDILIWLDAAKTVLNERNIEFPS